MADNRWFTIAQCLRACVICFVISHGHSQNLNTACIEVKKAYTEKGFDENEVPIAAISGADLSICPQGETCCTRSMEDRLTSLSRKEHRHTLDESFKILKSIFASRTRKFDEFFTELLDNARNDLHEMFVKTYGLLYQQNAAIFTQLFDDLRGYYKGKDKKLMEVMENFFSKLLQKMFELLNSTYQFDDEYLRCVTVRMDDLKPFGDVPQKLSLHVKRAFIAARTFVQGLAVGRDVVTQIMEMAPSDSCVQGIVRMTYCPHCRGLTSTKPCSNYCLNTMKGCLAHQAELNDVWNEYIDALNNLAGRLEGPFNIESVVDPIDVKISDAIMNLQENSAKVTTKIFAGCGTPQLSRKRRDQSDVSQTYTFEFPKTSHVRPTTAAGTSLDRLVRDIKERVKTAKDFWVQLPYVVCNNENVAADPSRVDDCWNGQDRAKYIPEVQKDGVIHQINNPEVEVDVSKVNSLVNRQRVQLQLITNKLQHAYRGESVEWVDTEIDSVSSGSGSGDFVIDADASGSGMSRGGPEDDEDSDFNIEENPVYTTGGRGHGSEHGGHKKPHGGKGKPMPGKDTNTWLGKDEHIIRKPGTGPKPTDEKNLDRDRNNYNRPGGNRRGNEERRDGGRGDMKDSATSLSISMTVLLLVLSLQTGLRRLMLSW